MTPDLPFRIIDPSEPLLIMGRSALGMEMNDSSGEERCIARIRDLVVSLPYDLKLLFEIMSDEDLPSQVRDRAAGGIVYCLDPSDSLPDSRGVMGFVDDAVLLRLLLADIDRTAAEALSDYRERFREQFDALADDERLFEACFGEQLDWVRQRLSRLTQRKYKGKRVHTYVEDENAAQRLYDESLAFSADYDVDEHAAQKLRSMQEICEAFATVAARSP